MSDEYTPTTDDVRDRYADARVGIGEWTRFDESVKRAVEDAYAEFDRWLAEVERAAAEKAWSEGAESAFYNPEIRGYVDYPDENPYRQEGNEG